MWNVRCFDKVDRPFLSVTRGLDPRVHLSRKMMDCRVKPGNDADTLAPRIFAFHFGEESVLAQAVENAGVDEVVVLPALERRELVDDVLGAGPRRFEVH